MNLKVPRKKRYEGIRFLKCNWVDRLQKKWFLLLADFKMAKNFKIELETYGQTRL